MDDTYVICDGGSKSEDKARKSSIDGRSKNRYEGRQANDNSRKEVEPDGKPSVHCTIRHEA